MIMIPKESQDLRMRVQHAGFAMLTPKLIFSRVLPAARPTMMPVMAMMKMEKKMNGLGYGLGV